MSKLFSSKKKAGDGPAAYEQAIGSLHQPASPMLKKSATSRWKKTKKQPEQRPQLDLTAALPSTDDFRTSLLMPSLSTRFSMLREQDDPNSLLGKASDDSVLQPRRRSRIYDFGGFSTTALGDIAEVSSINGSLCPPFAHRSREHSYVSEDGYGSEADTTQSIMSRSRPGEGNILFGGRQKVYKIPASGAVSTRSLGKLVYEDDVGMSAFQRYRQKPRDVDESQLPRPSDESQGFDFGLDQGRPGSHHGDGLDTLPNDSAKDLSHSPSLSSYDKKRSTTSSDARSDARSSTVATSIASQQAVSAYASPAQAPATSIVNAVQSTSSNPAPIMSPPLLDRSHTKARRLYDQGLDQHMQEQQTSAITRLNSIQRQRTLNGKNAPLFLQGTKSTGNLNERSDTVQAYRGQSPPPTAPLPPLKTLGSVRKAHSGSSSPAPMSSPTSPIEGPNSVLTQALEPADRGKATAMGAFNKPAHAFDEQQYLERQKALQRSNSSAVVRKTGPSAAVKSRIDRAEQDRQPSSDTSVPERNPSDAPKQKELTKKAYKIFQNAASHLPPPPVNARSASPAKSPLPDTHHTFFGNIRASDDEEDEEEDSIARSFSQPEYGYGMHQSKWQSTPLQPVSEHPALRREKSKGSVAAEVEDSHVKALKPKTSESSLKRQALPGSKVEQPTDSPTLGPQTQPLNGMVHHLRQRSNTSSVYPHDDPVVDGDGVPQVPEVPWTMRRPNSANRGASTPLDVQSARESAYAVSNPWDLDEQSAAGASRASRASDAVGPGDRSPSAPSPVDRSSMAQFSPVERTDSPRWPANRQSEVSLAQEGFAKVRSTTLRADTESSLAQENSLPAWQQELRKQHTRDPSTATQQERDAFQSELAARRAAIQEGLKHRTEREAQSRGTSPAPSALKPFGLVRSKTSRESFAHDQPQKIPKSSGSSNSNLVNGDSARPRGDSSPRPPPVPNAQHPAFKHEGPGPSTREMDAMLNERALASSKGQSRSRSNSTATTGRSQSRTGRYRDDLEKAMVEGHGSTAAAYTPEVSPYPGASPDLGSAPAGRDSDESKNGMSNYFDPRNLSRLNGSSPAGPGLNAYAAGRSIPLTHAYSQNHASALRGANSFDAHSPITPSSARPGGLRKMTISKSDISEPTLISSTSNVDTVDLPAGASLKNGMDQVAPSIPPMNPRRRATRKLFSRNRSDSSGDHEPRATASDTALHGNTAPDSPRRDYHFPPSNIVRLQGITDPERRFNTPGPQYGSPERLARPAGGPQRSVTAPLSAPLDGGMF